MELNKIIFRVRKTESKIEILLVPLSAFEAKLYKFQFKENYWFT